MSSGLGSPNSLTKMKADFVWASCLDLLGSQESTGKGKPLGQIKTPHSPFSMPERFNSLVNMLKGLHDLHRMRINQIMKS